MPHRSPQSERLDGPQTEATKEVVSAFVMGLQLRTPITAAGGRVRVYPIDLAADPESAKRDHVLLRSALADGATVKEVGQGSVPELELENPLPTRVLGIEGEVLSGCRQNRLLNTWLMVAARSTVRIPVSCVERGRWSFRTQHMNPAGRVAPRRVRYRAKEAVRSAKLAGALAWPTNQSEVWAEIDGVQQEFGFRAPGDDLVGASEHYEQHEHVAKLRTKLGHGLKGSAGYALALDGRFESVELFGHTEDFAEMAESYIAPLAAEVSMVGYVDDAERAGFHDEQLVPTLHAALDMQTAAFQGVALGVDLRAGAPHDWSLSALVEGGQVRTLSALRRPGSSAPHAPRTRTRTRRPHHQPTSTPFRMHTLRGHTTVRTGAGDVVIDLASPESFSDGRPIPFAGLDDLRSDPERLERYGLRLGTPLAAVIGWDLLRDMAFTLDFQMREFTLGDAYRDAPADLRARLLPDRIAMVELPFDGVPRRAALSTTSHVTFAPPDLLEGGRPRMVDAAFHHSVPGLFEVSRIPHRVEIAGRRLRLHAAAMPRELRRVLRLDADSYVLGLDVLRRGRLTFDGAGEYTILWRR
jgi:hypothetical protein